MCKSNLIVFSHEKKKMYWEQLELRCRSFYQQPGAPPSTHGSIRGPPIPSTTYCSCCEECRYPSIPVAPQMYPWDTHHATDRYLKIYLVLHLFKKFVL